MGSTALTYAYARDITPYILNQIGTCRDAFEAG